MNSYLGLAAACPDYFTHKPPGAFLSREKPAAWAFLTTGLTRAAQALAEAKDDLAPGEA
jgi:hypothetical protein